jgi:hypothetical protein
MCGIDFGERVVVAAEAADPRLPPPLLVLPDQGEIPPSSPCPAFPQMLGGAHKDRQSTSTSRCRATMSPRGAIRLGIARGPQTAV